MNRNQCLNCERTTYETAYINGKQNKPVPICFICLPYGHNSMIVTFTNMRVVRGKDLVPWIARLESEIRERYI